MKHFAVISRKRNRQRSREKPDKNKQLIHKYGKEILDSPNFKKTGQFMQHGTVSVRRHSEQVAMTSLKMAHFLPGRYRDKDLVRGALLHDYFLYDWHKKKVKPKHIFQFYKLHGFTHPQTALQNAGKEFQLSNREKDIIKKHMWPLTLVPPTCREAWIVTAADKYCSLLETLHLQKYGRKKHKRRK